MDEIEQERISISVVIPAYNATKYIRESLESVLTQTYPPLETIVVDDGSMDDTVEIVRSYAGRVRLLQQEHKGVSAARNLGIRAARGDYIALLDSDDLWLPEKLELQAARLLEKKVAWVSCAFDYFDDRNGNVLHRRRKKLYEGDVLEKLFQKIFICSTTPVIKKSVFEEAGYFEESLEARTGEDFDMWLRIAALYPLGVVRRVLALVRLHPSSTMSSITVDEKLPVQLLRIDHAVARQPQRLSRYKNRVLARIYLNNGSTLLKQGEYERAQLLVDQAQQLNPYSLEIAVYWLILHTGGIGKRGYQLFRELKSRSNPLL